jgi:3' terminal RNA ribose 2'-O-methyltransferase Hen1
MLLTIATARRPATDLGWLLHKHPDKLQEFDLGFGTARVFYPEASEDRCAMALAVEVDPVERQAKGREQGRDAAYVSDRPYACGSYLSTAISRVLGTALSGRCEKRPDIAEAPMPLVVEITPVACRSRHEPAAFFEPLGWAVEAERLPLDPAFPEWDDSPYWRLRLTGEMRLSDALSHLYVLVAAMDGSKHYYLSDDEVEKLMRRGAGWLDAHPLRGTVVRRFLGSRRALVAAAFDALDAEAVAAPAQPEEAAGEGGLEKPLGLQGLRIEAAVERLAAAGARRVVDLGCGNGDLVAALLEDMRFDHVRGVDANPWSLGRLRDRLKLDKMQEVRRARVSLQQGAATYPDSRLLGYDAVALLEVIEHVDPGRLGDVETAVFGFARPRTVLVTTPNRERNARFVGLPANGFRHPDHRFEFDRAEFLAWCEGVAGRNGYAFETFFVGDDGDEEVGPYTQGAVFTLAG